MVKWMSFSTTYSLFGIMLGFMLGYLVRIYLVMSKPLVLSVATRKSFASLIK